MRAAARVARRPAPATGRTRGRHSGAASRTAACRWKRHLVSPPPPPHATVTHTTAGSDGIDPISKCRGTTRYRTFKVSKYRPTTGRFIFNVISGYRGQFSQLIFYRATSITCFRIQSVVLAHTNWTCNACIEYRTQFWYGKVSKK